MAQRLALGIVVNLTAWGTHGTNLESRLNRGDQGVKKRTQTTI